MHEVVEAINDIYVAPYVGAWIETSWPFVVSSKNTVAPYVGAWIETFLFSVFKPFIMSPLM